MMEAESGFLSKDESKENVFKVLNKVLTDLNMNKMTTIIEGETTIHLKVVSHFNDEPQQIFDYLVPLLNPKYIEVPRDAWDLTTQQVRETNVNLLQNQCFPYKNMLLLQVIPYINGVNHIARIAADSDVEIGLVKACIQNLVYYDVVEVLPLFKYSNVYMCTRNLQNLTIDKNLALLCR